MNLKNLSSSHTHIWFVFSSCTQCTMKDHLSSFFIYKKPYKFIHFNFKQTHLWFQDLIIEYARDTRIALPPLNPTFSIKQNSQSTRISSRSWIKVGFFFLKWTMRNTVKEVDAVVNRKVKGAHFHSRNRGSIKTSVHRHAGGETGFLNVRQTGPGKRRWVV